MHYHYVTGKDRKDGYLSGLTEGKKNVRFACTQEDEFGKFRNIIIESATDFSLEGKLTMPEVMSLEV
ncbi:MAG: TRAM domain-containing protein [Bacteroidota bacterium]